MKQGDRVQIKGTQWMDGTGVVIKARDDGKCLVEARGPGQLRERAWISEDKLTKDNLYSQ